MKKRAQVKRAPRLAFIIKPDRYLRTNWVAVPVVELAAGRTIKDHLRGAGFRIGDRVVLALAKPERRR